MGCKWLYNPYIAMAIWSSEWNGTSNFQTPIFPPIFNRNININVESGHTILPSIFEEIMEGDHWRIMSFAGNEVKKNSGLWSIKPPDTPTTSVNSCSLVVVALRLILVFKHVSFQSVLSIPHWLYIWIQNWISENLTDCAPYFTIPDWF